MKKTRVFLFYSSCFYSISIIFLMIYTLFNYHTSFYVEKTHDNLTKIKLELNNINKSSCNIYINSLVEYYENTNFSGEINIKDFMNIISRNNLTVDLYSCNYNEEDQKEINDLLLLSNLDFDLIKRIHDEDFKLLIGFKRKVNINYESALYENNRNNILKTIDISMNYFRKEGNHDEKQNI